MTKSDLTGQRFGMLYVLKEAAPIQRKDNPSQSRRRWLCRCDCGAEKIILQDNLKRGLSKSCGCIKGGDVRGAQLRTHGESASRLYAIWQQMKNRCYNKNATFYKDYGGRGISVCDDWKSSYECFRDWANSHGYTEDLTIDRIDCDGDYCPDNCRWVDRVAQANNRRSNRIYSYNGETHNVTEWAKLIGISPKTLFSRLDSGKSFEEAIQRTK